MGWFLSKKSTKAAKNTPRSQKLTKKKASPLATKGWDPAKTLANMWLTAWMLLLVIGAGAWYSGESYLMDRISEQHRAKPVTVTIAKPPAWMDDRLIDRLRQEIELMVDADPFDRASLERAAQQLQTKPWIEHVDRVVRTGADTIEVRATFRSPTALIEAEDGYHLVDRHGVRLPLRYSPEQASAMNLLVIRGVRNAPPLTGNQWPGNDVQAGLEFVRMLHQVDWGSDIAVVDVRNYAGRVSNTAPHIILPTHHGGLLRWGRALGQEQFYEPPAESKLRHVERVRRQFAAGTVCAGGRVVDVWRDNVQFPRLSPAEHNSSAELRYTLTSD